MISFARNRNAEDSRTEISYTQRTTRRVLPVTNENPKGAPTVLKCSMLQGLWNYDGTQKAMRVRRAVPETCHGAARPATGSAPLFL